jgi:hypothetical protein
MKYITKKLIELLEQSRITDFDFMINDFQLHANLSYGELRMTYLDDDDCCWKNVTGEGLDAILDNTLMFSQICEQAIADRLLTTRRAYIEARTILEHEFEEAER